MTLAKSKCVPCRAGTPKLTTEQAEEMLDGIPMWTLKDNAIEREFRFSDFRAAIDFVNKVADIADEQDHHPDIHISYNKVRLQLSTHKIGGLSENDFIMAAKIDQING